MEITIKAARVNAGLTQTAAARKAGISRTTLQNYENYETIPDIKTAKRLASIYGVSINDIKFYPEIVL